MFFGGVHIWLMERQELTPPSQEDSLVERGAGPKEAMGVAKVFWSAAGTFFLVIGIIGIALPILPTTPFLLLAAACYLRGSKRMHDWMMTNKLFGTHLRNYCEGKGTSRSVKVSAIAFLWAVITVSAVFFTSQLWLKLLLVVIAVTVSIHISTIKPRTSGGRREAN